MPPVTIVWLRNDLRLDDQPALRAAATRGAIVPLGAARREAILDDFFATCFGPAQEPMRGFYALIDGAAKPLVSEDLVARLYRHIDAALAAAFRAEALAMAEADAAAE